MSRAPDRVPGWWDDAPTSSGLAATVPPYVDVEPNPVVAVLLGPNGRPIRQLRSRRSVSFGFQPPEGRLPFGGGDTCRERLGGALAAAERL